MVRRLIMRKLLALAFILWASGAAAQNVQNHAIPLGKGPGVVGWGKVGPCAAGSTIIGQGASADPVCGGGQPIYNVQDYGWLCDGTDRSVQALALLTTVSNAGGGTIYFPPCTNTYRADSQLLIPNSPAGGTAPNPKQVNIKFTGGGGGQNWYASAYSDPVPDAVVLDLRYQGTGAKIVSLGRGNLSIHGLQFKDGGTSNATPFILTTNTTVDIRNNTFLGVGNVGQDAIILGGTGTTIGGGINDGFQGYGSVVDSNFFTRLNRGVYCRTYCNDVVISNNSFQGNVGTRAIEVDGTSSNLSYGTIITNNIFEMDTYTYGIVLGGVQFVTMIGNSFQDHGGSAAGNYRIENVGAPTQHKTIFGSNGVGPIISDPGGWAKFSSWMGGEALGSSVIGNGVQGNYIFPGAIVSELWQTAQDIPHQFVVYAAGTTPNQYIAFGINTSVPAAYIDSEAFGVAPRPINLNKRTGGAVQTGNKVRTSKTTDYPVTIADSSTQFDNIGAGAQVTFTLPSDPPVGSVYGAPVYGFYVQAAQTVKVLVGHASATIRCGGTVSAANGFISSNTVGSYAEVTNVDTSNGRQWVVTFSTGLWTVDGTSVSCAAAGSSGQIQYNNSGVFGGTNLWVTDANTIEKYNSTTAQAFNVYNTRTSGTNYERGVFEWTSTANTLTIGTEKGSGGGTARNVNLVTDGNQVSILDTNRHIRVSNQTAPALTSCGTNPSIIGTDEAGEVTMGTGSPTGCIITFNIAYVAAPLCVLNWQATPLASQSWTVSNTAITTVQTATSSNKLNYICRARNGG